MGVKKTYLLDGNPIDVDEKDVASFKSAHPDAKEAQSFIIGQDTVDVETQHVNDFLKSNPQAKSTFGEAPQVKAPATQMFGSQTPPSLSQQFEEPRGTQLPMGVEATPSAGTTPYQMQVTDARGGLTTSAGVAKPPKRLSEKRKEGKTITVDDYIQEGALMTAEHIGEFIQEGVEGVAEGVKKVGEGIGMMTSPEESVWSIPGIIDMTAEDAYKISEGAPTNMGLKGAVKALVGLGQGAISGLMHFTPTGALITEGIKGAETVAPTPTKRLEKGIFALGTTIWEKAKGKPLTDSESDVAAALDMGLFLFGAWAAKKGYTAGEQKIADKLAGVIDKTVKAEEANLTPDEANQFIQGTLEALKDPEIVKQAEKTTGLKMKSDADIQKTIDVIDSQLPENKVIGIVENKKQGKVIIDDLIGMTADRKTFEKVVKKASDAGQLTGAQAREMMADYDKVQTAKAGTPPDYRNNPAIVKLGIDIADQEQLKKSSIKAFHPFIDAKIKQFGEDIGIEIQKQQRLPITPTTPEGIPIVTPKQTAAEKIIASSKAKKKPIETALEELGTPKAEKPVATTKIPTTEIKPIEVSPMKTGVVPEVKKEIKKPSGTKGETPAVSEPTAEVMVRAEEGDFTKKGGKWYDDENVEVKDQEYVDYLEEEAKGEEVPSEPAAKPVEAGEDSYNNLRSMSAKGEKYIFVNYAGDLSDMNGHNVPWEHLSVIHDLIYDGHLKYDTKKGTRFKISKLIKLAESVYKLKPSKEQINLEATAYKEIKKERSGYRRHIWENRKEEIADELKGERKKWIKENRTLADVVLTSEIAKEIEKSNPLVEGDKLMNPNELKGVTVPSKADVKEALQNLKETFDSFEQGAIAEYDARKGGINSEESWGEVLEASIGVSILRDAGYKVDALFNKIIEAYSQFDPKGTQERAMGIVPELNAELEKLANEPMPKKVRWERYKEEAPKLKEGKGTPIIEAETKESVRIRNEAKLIVKAQEKGLTEDLGAIRKKFRETHKEAIDKEVERIIGEQKILAKETAPQEVSPQEEITPTEAPTAEISQENVGEEANIPNKNELNIVQSQDAIRKEERLLKSNDIKRMEKVLKKAVKDGSMTQAEAADALNKYKEAAGASLVEAAPRGRPAGQAESKLQTESIEDIQKRESSQPEFIKTTTEVTQGNESPVVYEALTNAIDAGNADLKEVINAYKDITGEIDTRIGIKGVLKILADEGIINREQWKELVFRANNKLTEAINKKERPLTKAWREKLAELSKLSKEEDMAQERARAEDKSEVFDEEKFNKKWSDKVIATLQGKKVAKGSDGLRDMMGSFPLVTPELVRVLWNGAIDIAINSVRAGAKISKAIEDAVEYMRNSDWYKAQTIKNKIFAEKALSYHIEEGGTKVVGGIEGVMKGAAEEATKTQRLEKLKKEAEDRVVRIFTPKNIKDYSKFTPDEKTRTFEDMATKTWDLKNKWSRAIREATKTDANPNGLSLEEYQKVNGTWNLREDEMNELSFKEGFKDVFELKTKMEESYSDFTQMYDLMHPHEVARGEMAKMAVLKYAEAVKNGIFPDLGVDIMRQGASFEKQVKAVIDVAADLINKAIDAGLKGEELVKKVIEEIKGHPLYKELAGKKRFNSKETQDALSEMAKAMEEEHLATKAQVQQPPSQVSTPTAGAPVNPSTPITPKGGKHEWISKDWNKAYKESIIPEKSNLEKIGTQIKSLWNQARRTYEHIPKTAKWATFWDRYNTFLKGSGIASVKSTQRIHKILGDLTQDDVDLFTKKIIINDLLETVKLNPDYRLPGDLTETQLQAEAQNLNQFVEANPKVQEAIKRRKEVTKQLIDEYKGMADKVGVSTEGKFDREDYFRHQVIMYANAIKGEKGSPLAKPTGLSIFKKRGMGGALFNRDYIQAEFEVFNKMQYAIEKMKLIDEVYKNYDIMKDLRENAKSELGEEATVSEINRWIEKNIPENYVLDTPDNMKFFMAESIPADMVKTLYEDMMEEVGVSKDDLRKVFALGSSKKIVIPKEIYDTLYDFSSKESNAPTGFTNVLKKGTRAWKAWITVANPLRTIKFFERNLTGDMEKGFLGNPRGFSKAPKSLGELIDVAVNGKQPSESFQQYIDRGGIQLSQLVQEMGEVKKLPEFEKYYDAKTKVLNMPLEAINKYSRGVQLTHNVREQIMRYANFMDYVEQMKQNKGNPLNYGASSKKFIDALPNIYDKAFRLSNELIGAYDSISQMGRGAREIGAPFWSFQESNIRGMNQLLYNAIQSGSGAAGKTLKGIEHIAKRSPFIAYRMTKLAMKMGGLWAGTMVWNNMFFRDEEDELPKDVRKRPHIIFGRNEDGSIRYLSRLGVMQDYFEWFGLDAAPSEINDVINNKKTIGQMAKNTATAPLKKTIGAISPFIKTPAELIFKKKLFPDFTNPAPIRDRMAYVFESLGIGDQYNKIAGLPSVAFIKQARKIFFDESEPMEGSYFDVKNMVRDFNKDIKGTEVNFNPSSSEKAMALYYYKKAITIGDSIAANKYLSEYIIQGGDDLDAKSSIERMKPDFGIKDEDRAAFNKYIGDEGTKKLKTANKYYSAVLKEHTKAVARYKQSPKPKQLSLISIE